MPSSPALLLLLLPFQLILLFPLPTHSQNSLIITTCSGDDTFTSTNPYASNLQLLLSNLTSSTPNSSSLSSTFSTSQIFGLSQCRPDISPSICSRCLSDASSTATTKSPSGCGNRKSAALRFEYCFLRYSDKRFFGVVDSTSAIYSFSFDNASDPAAFDRHVQSLMSEVSSKAASAASRFAVGIKTAVGLDAVYGMAWCTPDLFTSDCAECLQSTAEMLVKGKIGTKAACSSCFVRSEVYAFFSLDLLLGIPPPTVPPAAAEEPTARTVAEVAGRAGGFRI